VEEVKGWNNGFKVILAPSTLESNEVEIADLTFKCDLDPRETSTKD